MDDGLTIPDKLMRFDSIVEARTITELHRAVQLNKQVHSAIIDECLATIDKYKSAFEQLVSFEKRISVKIIELNTLARDCDEDEMEFVI